MKPFAIAIIALLVANAANAQIYQWKDESGKTFLSDKPPPGQVRVQRKLAPESATPASSEATQKSLADREFEYRKRQKESQESAKKSDTEQAAAADKRENCENARRRLQALESGERITMRDDKGERYFLEDAQREQEIARVRQAVQSNCAP